MAKNEKKICCELFDIENWIPEFLIDDAKRNALCFWETLIICLKNESAKDTKPIGSYCILVESIGPQANELLVHVQSSMSIDGYFGGSKVISSATSKFHCLEEKRTEFVYEDNGLYEKTIFIGIEDNFYHVKLTRTCPCNKSTEVKDLSCRFNSTLISEGVNILLMRYLALVNYEGTLSFESITIDGDLIRSNYTCTPAEQMEIDDHFLSVYTLERKMCWKDGTVHTIRTYLTPEGKILRHNWLDVPYILKINPLVNLKTKSKIIQIKTPLRDRWTEDIEMFSKYLDMKFSKVAEHTEYLTDHPEVKQLIADYIQTLLVGNQLHNWINIVPILLRQHFKAFTKEPKIWETSISEEIYDADDIISQLAKEKSDVECSICGFCIDCSMLQETFAKSSAEACSETINSSDFTQSNDSKSPNSATHDRERKNDASTSKMSVNKRNSAFDFKGNEQECNVLATVPRLKRTCDQCQAIVRTCHQHEPYSKCPSCLKVFNMCVKCSAIDQILQKLKGDTNMAST